MKKLLLSLLAFLLILEEWIWEWLTALGYRLSAWLHLLSFDRWLLAASPRVAMATFLLPVLLVTPFKLVAVWLMARGHVVQGIALLVAAKLAGTLLLSHLFALTREKLLSFRWFARLHGSVTYWLGWARERIRATAVYRQARLIRQIALQRLSAWRRRLQPLESDSAGDRS
ncbi:hypothetical protein [Methyloparacoccus murrellii]